MNSEILQKNSTQKSEVTGNKSHVSQTAQEGQKTHQTALSQSLYFGELQENTVIARDQEKILLVPELRTAHIKVEENSRLIFVYFGGAGFADLAKVTFELAGRGSEVLFLGFIVGNGQDKFVFETFSNHFVPNTKAHYYIKGAMFDHSQVDYKGNILITKPAQMTDTYLAHHTLLLSDYSRARTIPGLEIEADDVKAGHAATVGKVDEEFMFYLKSRGLDAAIAEKILIQGFFEDQLKMIPDEELQQLLRSEILSLLPFHAAD